MSTVITKSGVQAPTQAEVIASLQRDRRRIYGEDIELEPNTPDGQEIGIEAQAITDINEGIKNLFASLFPSLAEGNYLDWNMDLISLRRISGSPASILLRLDFDGTHDIEEGTYVVSMQGTNFTNDKAITEQGLYAFTAADNGAMQFAQGDPVSVTTPVIGITASYASTISNGSDYESDTDFRRRWRDRVANRSGSSSRIAIGIEQIDGVADCKVYETTNYSFDIIPPNSIYAVVMPGSFDYDKVLDAIYRLKPPGIRSFYSSDNPPEQSKLFGDGMIAIGFDLAKQYIIPRNRYSLKFKYKASGGEANEGDILALLQTIKFRIGETVFVSDIERFVLDAMPELFAERGNHIDNQASLTGMVGTYYVF